MKKKMMLLALVLVVALFVSACGGSSSTNSDTTTAEPAATETEAPAEKNDASASTEAAATAETAGDAVEVDVGGPYPATTNWDEYVITPYYFAETDETLDMLIETNEAHDKFEVLFTFFGDKQDMAFSVNGDELTVDSDLTGFIGKDVQNIYTFIQENITSWNKIGAAAEVVEVDVGGPFPATTNWDEYVVVPYYFEETDENVDMLIETNKAHDKFEVLFNFFGDKQDMAFSVNGDELTVDSDLTGFIGKDVQKIYTFIQENITDWNTIG